MISPLNKKQPLAMAVAGVLALAAVPHALAQEESIGLEEVIVTAERREASLQSTAIAVTAMSQETLVENDILNVTGLNGFVPNLVVSGQEDQSDIKIYIRGVGTNNPTETGDQGVGVYVDGVFAARAQGALALMYDLENIQVLRGPQGTLFGRNNTGGAMLLTTRRPGKEFEGDVQMTYGSFNRQQVSGGVTLPVTDSLSFRVAAYSDQDDGWVKPIDTDPRGLAGEFSGPTTLRTANTVGLKLNNTDVRSARLTGLWEITDGLDWSLSYETFTDQGNTGILLNPVEVEKGNFNTFIDSPVSLHMQSDVVRSTVSYDITDGINVEYIFGASDLSREQVVDQDAGVLSMFREARTEYQNSTAASHELKFQNLDAETLEWTVGLYYFEEETAIRFDFDGDGPWLNQRGATFIQPARGSESAAAYGQLTYHITDEFSVTGGLRYTDDLKYDRGGRNYGDDCDGYIRPTLGGSALVTFEDFLNNRTGAEGADGLDDLTGLERTRGSCKADKRNDVEVEDDQLTYLVRASYEWDDQLAYLSVGSGYRAGVIQDAGGATEPENSTSYELGYKVDFERVRLNAAAFFMQYDNLIRSGYDEEENQIVNSNVAGAEISGLELELTWLVGEAGMVDFSGGYLDAHYTDYVVDNGGYGDNNTPILDENGEPTGLYDLAGNIMPQSPEFSFNIGFRWDFALAKGTLTPRFNMRWVDDVYFRDQNENSAAINNVINDVQQTGRYYGNPAGQDAHTKVNLGLMYDSGENWTVDLFVNNATNEMTKSSSSVDNNTAAGFPGRYAAPRTAGVRFAASF
ncbi:TonB-dependent receptor [Simiduia agarivorans]|uniref:Helix-turn-helix, AraC type n=1 Tax=Simiduia agarivorans (strain DSM 21679 / JCM 13881 / BCRC 17597 / SA1) TaxID=1117647 RepID=K4KX62_SIMAS|nr:TonB-dependent receptor [Simiduia agarivorans]AFU98527.1 helix-turn-helix, AraC type [Simiduia agarivorans SA1 = DSM 21679]